MPSNPNNTLAQKNFKQENPMSRAVQKQTKNGGSIELPSSALPPGYVPMPRMTESEVDAELARLGETREQIRDEFRAMESMFRAKYQSKKPVIEPETSDGPIIESVRFFEDRVAAGHPQWNAGNVTGRDLVLSDLFGKQDWKNVFITKVVGWSMTNEHITDGDVVLVDATAEPKDGDIVVAFIPGEGQVVKRLRIFRDRLVLESAHPDFKPIIFFDPSELVIQGVVKGRSGPL